VRLPGSGGAAEIAIHARRTVVISRLDRRAFPNAVDFVTSPGHRAKGRGRRDLGMPGAGPTRVVTDKGILEPEIPGGELMLSAVYPGITAQDVASLVGWPLRSRTNLTSVAPPADRELHLLRHVLDPDRIYLTETP
jgi:glutaconate CoA-transferase subunit B